MDLKTLSIPPNRRRVCYGPAGQEELEILVPLSLSTYGIASSKASLSEKKLHGFISSCHRMKLSRQEREQFRLQRLKLIYRRFETITLFKSWYKYLLCRRIHRRHTLFFHLMKWRKCYLLARYSILSALVNRMTPLLRSAFQIWWRVTLHLRAAEFYRRNLLVRMMRSWKLLLENSSKRLLLNYFQRWKLYLLLLTKLRKLDLLYRILPRKAFLHWKLITFRVVDFSPVLERIRMRILESVFYYLWNLSEKLKHDRLLASLPTREPTLEIPTPKIPQSLPLKSPRKTRKAPLDNWRTPCKCVYNICTGQRCVCTFDTHLKRRIAMCFDEFTELETEKKIAKEVIKQALKDYPKKPLTPQRSSVLAGRSPARTPKKERNQNQEVGQQDSLEKENIGNTSTPSRPALRTPPASPHPNLQDSVDGFLPSSAILAHQSFAPPRPPLHHDATPDRRRKEAILRVKGTPTHHPMSRWSLEKSQER